MIASQLLSRLQRGAGTEFHIAHYDCMAKQKLVIPEPSPRFFGWSLTVGLLIVVATMVLRIWTG
jgi:hypothetical protein